MNPAERFRHHHQELISEFNRLARELRQYDEESISDFQDFLNDELLPHAKAEESRLYSVVDEVAGTDLATASMRQDHEELESRIEEFNFARITEHFLTELNQFSALLLNHFEKEEDVLLPFLQKELEDETFNKILAEVHDSEDELRD